MMTKTQPNPLLPTQETTKNPNRPQTILIAEVGLELLILSVFLLSSVEVTIMYHHTSSSKFLLSLFCFISLVFFTSGWWI